MDGEDYTLSFSSVKSYLSDVDPGFNNPAVRQNQGYGLNGYVETWANLFGINLHVKAYGRYWDIEESQTSPLYYHGSKISEVHEPTNTATNYGIGISWIWR